MSTKGLPTITEQFLTYNSKSDPSNTDQRFLVQGSINVLINDSEKFMSRQGTTLYGAAGTTGNGIMGSTEWGDSSGDEFSLRAHDTVLEVTIEGNYETLADSLASVDLIFDTYWDNTQAIDRLVWCDGSTSIYTWSGGVANLLSFTNTTGIMLTYAIASGGSSYLVGDTVSVLGAGSGAIATVTSVMSGGAVGIVNGVIVYNGGNGYKVGDIVTIAGGDGGARLEVTVVNAATGQPGPVESFIITAGGTTYTTGQDIATTPSGGTGSGLTVDIIGITGNGAVTGLQFTAYGSGYVNANNIATSTTGGGASLTVDITATTQGSLTLSGAETFAEHRFLIGGGSIRIKDDSGAWHTLTYAAGESTKTLIGLSLDLTQFSFTNNNLILQSVTALSIESFNYTVAPATSFVVDFLQVIQNQLYLGCRTSNKIFMSKNTSITDFSYSSPRVPGEGVDFTLDGPGRALGTLKSDIIMFAGTDYIYKTNFVQTTTQITVGASLEAQVTETVTVVPLKVSSRQSALHQNLICNTGNGLAWIGADNVMYKLTDDSLAYNPTLEQISDPVKPDFAATDFTGGHMFSFQTRILISAPKSTVNFIYEYRLTGDTLNTEAAKREYFWQPPQTLAVNRWGVVAGALIGHSSATNETYNVFIGYNDVGQAIHCIAILARWNGGARTQLKMASEMFNEGSISANTTLAMAYLFDKDGGDGAVINKIVNASSENLIYSTAIDESEGNLPLGDVSLEGDVTGDDTILHIRWIDDINPQEFFDYGVIFETNSVDYRWEIMCHAVNAELSTGLPTGIKNN